MRPIQYNKLNYQTTGKICTHTDTLKTNIEKSFRLFRCNLTRDDFAKNQIMMIVAGKLECFSLFLSMSMHEPIKPYARAQTPRNCQLVVWLEHLNRRIA